MRKTDIKKSWGLTARKIPAFLSNALVSGFAPAGDFVVYFNG